MIEVEKKFLLSEEEERRLLEGAMFISEKTFRDTYYDTEDFTLTTKDWWLRSRDHDFHLKISAQKGLKRHIGEYHELEIEKEIREALKLPETGTFKDDLLKSGYIPFASFTTTRRRYKRGGFFIDLDTADFGYKIAEIELLVKDESGQGRAVEKIFSFARSINLPIVPMSGKAIEYIRRNRPAHYDALVKAGTINWEGSRE